MKHSNIFKAYRCVSVCVHGVSLCVLSVSAPLIWWNPSCPSWAIAVCLIAVPLHSRQESPYPHNPLYKCNRSVLKLAINAQVTQSANVQSCPSTSKPAKIFLFSPSDSQWYCDWDYNLQKYYINMISRKRKLLASSIEKILRHNFDPGPPHRHHRWSSSSSSSRWRQLVPTVIVTLDRLVNSCAPPVIIVIFLVRIAIIVIVVISSIPTSSTSVQRQHPFLLLSSFHK